LEAIVGAVFVDSEGDMAETRQVVMRLIEPYLYIYGAGATNDSHPRTDAIQLLNNNFIGNIKGHPIKIAHFSNNEKNDQGEMVTVYRGSLGTIDVVQMSF
jgi:dsRNA-specific ribonuclease